MTALGGFEERLRAELPGVYVIVGGQQVLRERAERAIVEAVMAHGGAPPCHDRFPAGEEAAMQALAIARTMPMFARLRLVAIVRAEQAPAALLEALCGYLDAPSPSTVLLVEAAKWPPPRGGEDWGRRLEARARAGGFLLRLDDRSLRAQDYVRELARELGCTIGQREAWLLVELAGKDLGRLRGEVEKAALWAGGSGRIGADAIREVCCMSAEAVIWSLTDAIVARDPDRALGTAHRLMEDGEAPHRLLSMLAWQFRQLLRLRSAQRRGQDPKALGIKLWGRKLGLATAALRSRAVDPARIMEALLRANHRMNSSRAGDRRELEALLLELTAGGSRRPAPGSGVGR